VDTTPKDDAEFPKADRCLMIFEDSQVYESYRQRCITEQDVNAVVTP
jgi:hypothetical protein